MFTIYIIILTLYIRVNANLNIDINDITWGSYIQSYDNLVLTSKSFQIFRSNVNDGIKRSFTSKNNIGVNPYLHITHIEFNKNFITDNKYYNKIYDIDNNQQILNPFINFQNNNQFSWLDKEFVLPIVNILNEKSWVYIIKNAIESAYIIKYEYKIELDIKNIIYCNDLYASKYGDYNISPFYFLEYSKYNNILLSEYNRESVERCISNVIDDISVVKSINIIFNNLDIYNGPIIVELALYSFDMQYYDGSIINLDSFFDEVNYYGLIVGFGIENNQKYWLVQTSFGSSWGYNGCIKMNIESTAIINKYQVSF